MDEYTIELCRKLIDAHIAPLALKVKECADCGFLPDLSDYQLQHNRLVELRAQMTLEYLSANETALASYSNGDKRLFIQSPLRIIKGESQ